MPITIGRFLSTAIEPSLRLSPHTSFDLISPSGLIFRRFGPKKNPFSGTPNIKKKSSIRFFLVIFSGTSV